jgi:uncharacterized protein YgbK (DUF1537 family)
MTQLLMTYYGDDFTGSTDALEALTLGGVPTVLFLEPPTREVLAAQFPHVRAVGVAGASRAMTPPQMDDALPPAFTALKLLAPLCHYKVCSTFDSSPSIGSIGRALDIGAQVFGPAFVPVVVGAPALRRYMAFGNLFATVGAETFRLDRHPTMSKHPVTPMQEGDLRRHLGQQTTRRSGLVDLLTLAQGNQAIEDRLQALLKAGDEVVFFDTLDMGHLAQIGRVLWTHTAKEPLFVVGSSGVEYALTMWWREAGLVQSPTPLDPPGAVDQIIVMSGSASPATAEQIAWAEAHHFHAMRLNVPRLLDPQTEEGEAHRLCEEALTILAQGQSPLFYSARGPDDPVLTANGQSAAQQLGVVQGRLLRRVLEASNVTRICIAGGDTSSQVVQQLGISAMSMRYPLSPGAPLCRAYASLPRLDGLELSLKGGQVGEANFFGMVRDGQ